MEVFDMGIIKREPLEEFQAENTYFDHLMPYNTDVFDATSVDWLSTLVEDRPVQSLDQLGHVSEYPNFELSTLNRDQTLNRLNGLPVHQRGIQDEIPTNAFAEYNSSQISTEFDHRLEAGTHDLDPDMKSFYSSQHLYPQGLNTVNNIMDFHNDTLKANVKNELTVSAACEEDEGIRLSGDSDRDSESGERDPHCEELPVTYENLVLKSCEKGYDSGAHSPTSETPSTPPRCLLLTQVDNDGSSTGDVNSPNEQTEIRQPFFLSEEEKRTLITEGLPIPAGYPLTKTEERALKKVRRKIKNKISAQESRRKKKEYMETLEKRVEICANENLDLRKKLDTMEAANRTLINQLQKLQAIVASKVARPTCTISTQTTEKARS